jgi:hypothetical protein
MRRHAFGIIAIVLLLAAGYLWIWPLEGSTNALWQGAFIRIGALMAVIWLAYREVSRLPGWIWGVLPLLLVILAWRPRYFLLALPIVLALALLKPRGSRRG